MPKVDKSIVGIHNKEAVINTIRDNSPIFRAEIARLTGLSIPTVMKITDEFKESGLIYESGKRTSEVGKPPKLLSFVPDAKYIIGVDVGTTHVGAVLMDLSARILLREWAPTHDGHTFPQVLEQTIQCIQKILDASSEYAGKILGIGVGVPGLISVETGKIILSPAIGWHEGNFLAPLKERFRLPVVVDNVVRAMAMGELWFGAGRGLENFFCIGLGYGIGSSIVIGKQIYSGSTGTSGEFGHMTIDKNGPLCDCGCYGCLEAIASANAISKQARFAISNGANSMMFDIIHGNLNDINAKVVFDAAKAGDSLANTIVNQVTVYLGIAISNVINLLDPQLIILGGGVSQAGDFLLNPLLDEVSRHVLPVKEPHIVISSLGEDAVAIGAATFLLKEYVESGKVQ